MATFLLGILPVFGFRHHEKWALIIAIWPKKAIGNRGLGPDQRPVKKAPAQPKLRRGRQMRKNIDPEIQAGG